MADENSTQQEQQQPTTDQTSETSATGEEQLGDAGKKALDRMKAERDEARRQAKANADAAKRLAEIEDAQKSEAEKAADRIAKAEAEVAAVPTKVADALRAHLVTLHGISDEDAELFLTANDPEVLLKQVDRLVARNTEAAQDQRLRGNHVPNEGGTRAQTFNDPRAADLAQIEADLKTGSRA